VETNPITAHAWVTVGGVVVQGGPVVALWSPSYYIVSLLGGYQTKIFNRTTSFLWAIGKRK